MIALPLPQAPAPLIAQVRHPVARPKVGGFYYPRPIHSGYREGRPAPVIRQGLPVEVLGNSKGAFPRATYFQEGPRVRVMPTRQFNQRYGL